MSIRTSRDKSSRLPLYSPQRNDSRKRKGFPIVEPPTPRNRSRRIRGPLRLVSKAGFPVETDPTRIHATRCQHGRSCRPAKRRHTKRALPCGLCLSPVQSATEPGIGGMSGSGRDSNAGSVVSRFAGCDRGFCGRCDSGGVSRRSETVIFHKSCDIVLT